jgi:phosphoribosyl-AMP cyclohydrolase
VRLEGTIKGLEQTLLERVVGRLLVLEPEATAVLLTGSYAKGTATGTSDLDLMVLTPIPRVGYRTWFEERRAAAPLQVSAGVTTADLWVAKTETPARWSLGFPAISAAVYLRTDEQTRVRLGDDPSLMHPAGEPELEDFVEFVLKAKRCARDGDELGLRLFAQEAASLAPGLLIPLNDDRIVHDRRDALDAARDLAVAPQNYTVDLTTCLGLTSLEADEVNAALGRLGKDLLAFLRSRAPDVDKQPELPRYLADGTLERQLALIE